MFIRTKRRLIGVAIWVFLIGWACPTFSDEFLQYQQKAINEYEDRLRYNSDQIKFGLSYYMTDQVVFSSSGLSLEFEKKKFVMGVNFHRGMTQNTTMLKGEYALVPLYVMQKLALKEDLYLNLGVGGMLCSVRLSSDILAALETQGFAHSYETVDPSPVLIIGVNGAVPFWDYVEFSARFFYNQATLRSGYLNGPELEKDISFSGIFLTLSYLFPIPEYLAPITSSKN